MSFVPKRLWTSELYDINFIFCHPQNHCVITYSFTKFWLHLPCPQFESLNSGESGTSGKVSACQCRRCKGCPFDPCVGKMPWRRKWQPSPVFLPGKFHEPRSLLGYSPRGCKESDIIEHTYHVLGTERPGMLQSMGLQRVWHDRVTEQQQHIFVYFLL